MIAAAIVIAAGMSAQPETAGALQQLKTAASRVLLAAVTDAQDRPLVDLGPDDFAITESGSEREVFSVYIADYPVVVLLDEGATSASDIQAIRSAVVRFISRLGPRAVAIGTLAPPAIVTSFEDDRAVALAKLEAVGVDPMAILAPIEAVSSAARMIASTGAPFSAIVVISARPIDGSQPEAPGQSQTIFESGAFVNAVVRLTPDVPATGGPAAPGRASQDLLRDLSEQTRGQYISVFSAASYAVALDRLADRLATELIIQYLIPGETPGTEDVRVGVKVPGARVRGLNVSR